MLGTPVVKEREVWRELEPDETTQWDQDLKPVFSLQSLYVSLV